MLDWRIPGDPLLDIALDQLTLARVALYRAMRDPAQASGLRTQELEHRGDGRSPCQLALDGLSGAWNGAAKGLPLVFEASLTTQIAASLGTLLVVLLAAVFDNLGKLAVQLGRLAVSWTAVVLTLIAFAYFTQTSIAFSRAFIRVAAVVPGVGAA